MAERKIRKLHLWIDKGCPHFIAPHFARVRQTGNITIADVHHHYSIVVAKVPDATQLLVRKIQQMNQLRGVIKHTHKPLTWSMKACSETFTRYL